MAALSLLPFAHAHMNGRARASSLQCMVRPRSVAVIGASPDLSRYPGKVLNNIRRFGFAGRVYAVTPNHDEIMGFRCYPDIESLPEPVDVALILLAAGKAPEALARAAQAGCRAAIVYSAGMAEIGGEGQALQAQLQRIAKDSSVRVLGPNCLGYINTFDKTVLCGAAALVRDQLIDGSIGVATQSGGIMGSIIDRAWAEGIGISYAFSTGNEADVDLADCVEFLAEDERTRAIALFIEVVRDVSRFRAACEKAAERGKPVVALKIGRSERGRHAALTHTGALAGDDRAYDALFRRLGIVRAAEADDLFLTANLLANSPPPRGPRVALACTSGGLAGLGADLCADLGITLSDLQPQTLHSIRELQAGFGDACNPLDITGHVVSRERWWMVRRIFELLLADPGVDLLVIGQPTSQFSDEASRDIIDVARDSPKPIAAFWTGRVAIAPALQRLRDAHIPVFENPAACLRAVKAAIDVAEFRGRRDRARGSAPPALNAARRDRALRLLARSPGGLAEHGSKRLLAWYGIAVPAEIVVRDAGAAVAAADRLGFPVAVKAHGRELRHKSERGAVRLNVRGARRVAAAYRAVTRAAGTAEALVARMIPPGPELILGLARDPEIGLLLLVGSGGIFAEIHRDAALALPPLWPGEADALLSSLRGSALLDGARGLPRCDRASVVDAIAGLSQLACEIGDAIEQVDVNPLIAGARGAWAADGLVIPRGVGSGNRNEENSEMNRRKST